MTGYLAATQHTLDDVPIRLCHSYDEAVSWLRNLDEEGLAGAFEAISRDESTVICGAIYEFRQGRVVN